MPNTQLYHVTPHLVTLAQDGKLLLANACRFVPFVITQGQEVVLAALEDLKNQDLPLPAVEDRVGPELASAFQKHLLIVSGGGPEIPDPVVPGPGHKKSGMSVYMLISQACNLNCVYCFATDYKSKTRKDMSWDVARQTMDRAFDTLSPKGNLTINFFGGEPMLGWPLIKKTIERVESLKTAEEHKSKTVSYHITTNLTIFPKDFVEWLRRYHISILTDVDGPKDVHDKMRPYHSGRGSHDAIVKNIGRLRRGGIKYEVRSTITSENVGRMSEIADYLGPLQTGEPGCVLEAMCPFEATSAVKPVDMIPDPKEYIGNLLRIYREGKYDLAHVNPMNKIYETLVSGGPGSKIGCGAPWNNLWIVDHQGDVYPCTFLTGNPDFLIGNVFDEGEFTHYEEYVNRMLSMANVDNIEDCRECQWKYMCKGGCPAFRLLYERTEVKHEKFDEYVHMMQCQMRKLFFSQLLWDIVDAKLFEKEAAHRRLMKVAGAAKTAIAASASDEGSSRA